MKYGSWILTLTLALVLPLVGCGDDDSETGEGTLTYQIRFPNGSAARRSLNTCTIVDARALQWKLEVSQEIPVEGAPDDLTWVTIHDTPDATLQLSSEFSVQATVPTGTYRSLKVTQHNLMYWVVECPIIGRIELPSLNVSDLPPWGPARISIVTPNGVYTYDESDNFVMAAEGETMSSFDVHDGGTTSLTFVQNFNTLDWNDTDDSSDWSEGDELDDWTLVDGKTTMFDIEVSYE